MDELPKPALIVGVPVPKAGLVHFIRRQTAIEHTREVIAGLPALLTHHGRIMMLVAYVSGIGHIVLQLPECTAVLLDTAFIAGTYPSTQINHRLVAFTFAGTDVITQFGMPYQIFNRSDLKRKILPVSF